MMTPHSSAPLAELYRCLRLSLGVIAIVLLAGCKIALHNSLEEREANEIMAALLDGGVDVDKVAVGENRYAVHIERGDMPQAYSLLRAQGLPRATHVSLGDVFRREGLVATPAEERVRFIYGLSQELEKTLSKIDGVVAARVHVAIPENDPLANNRRPSSAAVFIKHGPQADAEALGPVIRSLVVRSIEGLGAEHVSVAFVAAHSGAGSATPRFEYFLGALVHPGAVARLAWLFAVPVLLAIFLSLVLLHARQPVVAHWRQARASDGRGASLIRLLRGARAPQPVEPTPLDELRPVPKARDSR